MNKCTNGRVPKFAWVAAVVLLSALLSSSAISDEPLRIGMVGLDTSHAPAFTKLLNATDAKGALARMRVVAAFPGGSDDIESSHTRVAGFTQDLRELGVEMFDSVEAMLPNVDAVLLESVDGRKHLEQVLPVLKARKRVFIDKPLAGNLSDAIAIDLLSKKYDSPWFSSSSLRFSPSIAQYRESGASKVLGASAWSPCSLEPSHTDLFWYGIHGVETLYTAMGTGCQQVTRIHTEGTDLTVGVWDNGRVGVHRGIREGKSGYGLVVFGDKAIDVGGKYEGYAPLVDRIADFFLGGEAPVSTDETLELLTFMQAADDSKAAGGVPVKLADTWKTALAAAQQKVAKLDP
ncbi:MAG: Gfo/Idh/MocA family oxidoreductase [Pirellulaceae bacterium]